ncbi:MAG: M28 family peptidase [Pseudomonadota bacterium]
MPGKITFAIAFVALGFGSCSPQVTDYQPEHFSAAPALELLDGLSADALKGRGVGTPGSQTARTMIIDRLEDLRVTPIGNSFEHPFKYGAFVDPETGEPEVPDQDGVNIIGKIRGRESGGVSLVITAHYDHLGVRDGEIYNGADDNASGVVGALAIAETLSNTPPKHDTFLVFLDAEEDGFGGARAFISNPPIALEQVALNLNFDMISRGDNGLLWASGTHHWPGLIPHVKAIAETAPVQVQLGYDSADAPDDWTLMSDHAVFFRAGIPHLYFGVEDHPDYHQLGDDFEKIDQEWFLKSVDTLALMTMAMDEQLPEVFAMRQAALAEE